MKIRPFPSASTGIELAGEATTYLMALVGYGALAATRELGAVHGVIILVGVSIAVFRSEKDRPLGAFFWNSLVVGALVFGVAEWFFLEGGFVKAVVHFLAYVQLTRLLSRVGDRDTLWLHLLSFFQLTAASILTLSLSFLFFYFAYMVVATWALMIFTIKRESAKAGADVGREVNRPGFFITGAVVSIAIFAVAMVIFFMIPRMGTGFLGWTRKGGAKVVGYNETIQIGELGKMKDDRSTVMRIRIEGDEGPRQDIYWRGNAMDAFDGKSWSNASGGSDRIFPDIMGDFILEEEPRGETIDQVVFLEPIDSDVLFSASRPVSFRLKPPGSMRQDVLSRLYFIVLHGGGFVTLPVGGTIEDRIRYFARSDLYTPTADELAAAGDYAPPEIKFVYTQLPVIDDRVGELANEITKDSNNNIERVEVVKKYLLGNYSYSLDLPENKLDDPLAWFLFDSKKGHCELFATAMAVMLRSVGVPTRVVNGFQRGEFNDDDKYYRVRQSDAHSWVEVYFDGLGWTAFDPTPADSITYDDAPGLFARLDNFFDPWRYRWNGYIVDYNFDDQANATMKVRDRGAAAGAKFYGALSGIMRNILKSLPKTIIAAVSILAALVWVAIFISKKLSGRKIQAQSRESIRDSEMRRTYMKALAALEKKGLGRKSAETPMEHAEAVKSKNRDAGVFAASLAEYFGAAVYGERQATEKDLFHAKRLLGQIIKALERPK